MARRREGKAPRRDRARLGETSQEEGGEPAASRPAAGADQALQTGRDCRGPGGEGGLELTIKMTTENSLTPHQQMMSAGDQRNYPISQDDHKPCSRCWLPGGVSFHDSPGCCQDPPAGSGKASRQEVLPLLQWPDGSPLSQDKWRPALPSSTHSSGK